MGRNDFYAPLGEPGTLFSDEGIFTRMVIEKFGHFDKYAFVHLDEMATREWLERRKLAKEEAMELLRNENRPIRHQDLLDCMEIAVLTRADAFQSHPDRERALMLAATIVCKNILMDGPLHK